MSDSVRGESEPAAPTRRPHGLGRRMRLALSSSGLRSRVQRLQARIEALEARARRYDDPKARPVAEVILSLLASARAGLGRDGVELAWRLVSEAEREELQLLDNGALFARAVAIDEDAKANLPPDARAPIAELVALAHGADGSPAEHFRELVKEAVRFYDSWTIALFARAERVNDRVLTLTVILVLLVALLALDLAPKGDLIAQLFAANAFAGPMSFDYLLCAALLGGIGACVSALLSFTYQGRAPDSFEGAMVTLARPALGVTSGVIVTLAALSGLVTVGSTAMLTLLAFAAGFSERFVIGTVERIERRAGGRAAKAAGR